ncbi:DMT family transporter [Guptibacillus hwajinpoensis]|uniref:DMT family transporter n=1 Tax=Guptibacillus hwajinpoensis TaxID=208199 RepID=UPI001883803D|nr:DMT family transporter [Pseudalkalibacillus hwajinpoensis]MBF0707286.1 DMT family transporter [Pseudalkalibacillus hwajinpoensis]WLR58692.1 DMT family transporter [Pseudalkalibacillus hwajinpoensis]
MSDRNKGIILLLISSFGFAMMAAFVKLSGDVPTIQKTMFRNAVSAIISFGFVMYYKERLFGKKENQKFLLLRSALGTLGIIFYFYAIDNLVLSDADMLNKLSPFLLIIFSALFLKEKAKRFQIIAIIIAFIGTLLIIKPQFSVETVPYISGLLSAIFAAGAYTVLRVLGQREKFYTVVFYFSFFSTVVLLPFVIIFYEPMETKQLIYLLLAGVFATLGQFGLTVAYKFAPAREISIFFYSTVVYSALISIVLFGQIPDAWSIIGYIIIFSASFYMFIRNNREAKKVEKRQPQTSH